MAYRKILYMTLVFLCLQTLECNSREAIATTQSGIKDSRVLYLIASYYSEASLIKEGTRKAGERQVMANGRQFSNDNLTCASWDYPLGTKVKVTRTDTKASVVVLVADRTARRFKGKRIDLSLSAMHQIDAVEQGIVKVLVEKI